MTVDLTALDCPAIKEKYSSAEVLSGIRTLFCTRTDFSSAMSDESLFIYARSKYYGEPSTTPVTQARAKGEYQLWLKTGCPPDYIGSWFREFLRTSK